MRRKKFDFQEALQTTGVAVLSGAATGIVADQVGELVDDPKLGAFIPIALGAILSQQRDKNLQTAGVAMIGAGSGAFLDALNIDFLNGVGQPKNRALLTPAQQRAMVNKATNMNTKMARVNGAVTPGAYENALAGQ